MYDTDNARVQYYTNTLACVCNVGVHAPNLRAVFCAHMCSDMSYGAHTHQRLRVLVYHAISCEPLGAKTLTLQREALSEIFKFVRIYLFLVILIPYRRIISEAYVCSCYAWKE